MISVDYVLDWFSKAHPFTDDRAHNVYHEEAKKALEALIQEQVAQARIDEILRMRKAGDNYAAGDTVDYEGLCTVYDAHILKRAADLTAPQLERAGDESDTNLVSEGE